MAYLPKHEGGSNRASFVSFAEREICDKGQFSYELLKSLTKAEINFIIMQKLWQEQITMNKVYVLGSINCDLVMRSEKLPQAGETMEGQDFLINSGGKGANQAVACSKLGAETYLIGAVGNDVFGEICLHTLQEYGCSDKFISKISGVPTGIASIWVVGGDNRILLEHGANYRLEKEKVLQILKKHCKEGDVLISQFEIKEEIIEEAFRYARENGITTILNPAPVPQRGVNLKILNYTDAIVPNLTEAEGLCGFSIKTEDDLKRAADMFAQNGVKETMITLGEEGAYYRGKHGEQKESIIPLKVVDTTAAGDTTIGALAYRLAAGYTVKESMRFCAAASAITVSRHGAQQSIPTLEEINNLLNM